MSAPRPYETDPLHPSSSVPQPMLISIPVCIQKCPSYLSHMVLILCLDAVFSCHLRMRSCKTTSRFRGPFLERPETFRVT